MDKFHYDIRKPAHVIVHSFMAHRGNSASKHAASIVIEKFSLPGNSALLLMILWLQAKIKKKKNLSKNG